jgi:predicted enzyme related to lactoylglutathione lyase
MTTRAPGTFCWFECGSTDAAKSKAFYAGLFGWNTVDAPMPGDCGGHYTLLKVGESDVGGLYQMDGPQFEGVPSHWLTYVAVTDCDETAERARSLGADVMAPPMDVPGIGRIAVLRDPTGASFALFQAGEHRGAAELGPVHGAVGWSELATNDTAAAKAFYTELFDWGAKTDTGGPIEYTEFQLGGTSIGGMMALTPEHGDAPPHWLPYVLVDDCEATAAKVAELGGETIVAPRDIEDVGRFSVFADPTGAVLAVFEKGGAGA